MSEYPVSLKLLVLFHLWEQMYHRREPASNTLPELFALSSDHLSVHVYVHARRLFPILFTLGLLNA